jgi:hypothetical protein
VSWASLQFSLAAVKTEDGAVSVFPDWRRRLAAVLLRPTGLPDKKSPIRKSRKSFRRKGISLFMSVTDGKTKQLSQCLAPMTAVGRVNTPGRLIDDLEADV